ncbi:MAG: NYN domain-containing protein [Candidatus Thorarchaeota archaeon]
MGRVAVLIDNGFLAKILKNCYNQPRIDYEKLTNYVCGDRDLLRAYLYDCMPYQSNPPTQDEKNRYSSANKFFSYLRKISRFEVRFGKLKKTNFGFEQKRVDVLLSVDLVRMSWSNQIDTAIIIAGDSDFVPAIQAAKDAGVLVIVYHATCYDSSGNIRTIAHNELLDACDECKIVDQAMIDSIIMN